MTEASRTETVTGGRGNKCYQIVMAGAVVAGAVIFGAVMVDAVMVGAVVFGAAMAGAVVIVVWMGAVCNVT